MYTTRLIQSGYCHIQHRQVPEEVIMHHPSMADLKSYLDFHNLVLGVATLNTPFVEIQHDDGSPLTIEELAHLNVSEEAYAERILSALKPLTGDLPTHTETVKRAGALSPISGALHAIIAKAKNGKY